MSDPTAAVPAAHSVHAIENTLFFVLLQLIVIIATARLAGGAARRLGQPRAVGEIVAGLLLGPSLLGQLLPGLSDYVFHSVPSMPINILSQIGLILLMFQIGMDFDFSHLTARSNRKAVSYIAVTCIALPFTLGMALGTWSAPVLAPGLPVLPYVLFVGIAMSITAVPILGRILMEYDLTRTRIGAIAISAAAINDVVGWVLLAVVSAIAGNVFSPLGVAAQLGALALYVAVCWFGLRPLLRRLIGRHDLAAVTRMPGDLLAIVLALVLASAIVTYKLGIFAIFGGFMLGVLVHDRHDFVALWKRTIGDFVLVFFLPVFFTYTGLRTNVNGLDNATLWGWCLLFLATAVAGKMIGAYGGARFAGLPHHPSGIIGTLMNTRALMELIVLNVGYDAGYLPREVFTMLVIMAVVTTIMTGPVLRNQLPKAGHLVPEGIDA